MLNKQNVYLSSITHGWSHIRMALDTSIIGNWKINNPTCDVVNDFNQDFSLKYSNNKMGIKGILSTKIVIFSYPKLLSFSVLTFIKWRLTPSYAAKDTIFWQKRPKTIVIRIIVLDDNIQIHSYGLLFEPVLSMRTA